MVPGCDFCCTVLFGEVDMVGNLPPRESRCWQTFACGVWIAFGIWSLAATHATSQEPAKDLAQTYQRDFVGLAEKPPEWGLYGANADQFVKFEPEGVRITLPAVNEGGRPETGLAARTTLKGDFEVTVRYEILAEPTVAEVGNNFTRITLSVQFASPSGGATLSRRMQKNIGPQLFAWMSPRDKADGKAAPSFFLPATAKNGRLRIARTDGKLFYRFAENDAPNFRELASPAFRSDDVVEVRFIGATLGPNANFDVRVTDLQIRADSIANAPTAPKPAAPTVNLVVPTKQYAQEYVQTFKTDLTKLTGWETTGPDIETSLHFDQTGARFTLPVGWKGVRAPTGLKSVFGPKGDFEMTMHFEILAEPAQADAGSPVGTRLSLGIVKDTPHRDTSTLGRAITTGSGRVVVAWATVWNEEAGKMVPHTGSLKLTKSMIGRLRLVRSGNDLYYGISDGLNGDFQFFKKYPFGSEDVREVRIITGTGTEKASLDARVSELRIRADAIPDMSASQLIQGGQAIQPAPAPAVTGVRPIILLVIGVGAVVSVAIIVGLVVFLLKRRAIPATDPSVVFQCPTCRKKIKVSSELASKKVKCSQCGNAAIVANSGKE
jgi:hypothetical protein